MQVPSLALKGQVSQIRSLPTHLNPGVGGQKLGLVDVNAKFESLAPLEVPIPVPFATEVERCREGLRRRGNGREGEDPGEPGCC